MSGRYDVVNSTRIILKVTTSIGRFYGRDHARQIPGPPSSDCRRLRVVDIMVEEEKNVDKRG